MSNKLQITTIDASATQIQEPQTGVDTYGADVSLTDATGDEVAFDIQYTTNKATSGDDTGLVINQTNTASPGVSLLADFQVGGTTQVEITNTGNLDLTGAAQGWVYLARATTGRANGGWTLASNAELGWADTTNPATGTVDTFLGRAGKHQVRTEHTTNAETSGTFGALQVIQTYNQASGTAANTDLLINRTETAVGSGTQLFADFQVGGVSQLKFHTLGGIDFDGSGASTDAHAQSLNLNWSSGTTKTSSGQYSCVIGQDNTASGAHSFAFGNAGANSAPNALVGGSNNSLTGTHSFVWGTSLTIGATYSAVFGSVHNVSGGGNLVQGTRVDLTNNNTHAIGIGNTAGDEQVMTTALSVNTTDATETQLDGGIGTQDYVIPADTSWAFTALVVGRSDETDGNEQAAWEIKGLLGRDESSNTALVGGLFKTEIAKSSAASSGGWDVTVEADDTNEALAIKVTGEAATNIRWVAKVDISQVTFA